MAVIIPIISEWNAKGLNKSMADIQKAGSKFDKFSLGIEKASKTASLALVGLAAVGLNFAKGAAEDAQAAAVFSKALKNTTNATDAQVAAVEDWISAQGQLLGITDDELRPALTKLVTATRDVAVAQSLAATAMDISTQTGTSLESVSNTLAKAYAGNFKALKKLVPGISEAALASGDWAVVQAELNGLVGGAAATAADTAAGKYQIMQTQINEAKESIGAGLLPVIEKLIPYLTRMAGWLQNNSELVGKIGVAVAIFAGSIVTLNYAIKAYVVLSKAVKIATFAWTAAQWLLNVALTANPIGLIVVAIAALVAGVILAYKKSDTFRAIVDQLFVILKQVGTFIKNVLIGYFRLWLGIIDKVKNAVKGLVDRLKPIKDFFGGSNTVNQNLNLNQSSSSSKSSLNKAGGYYMTDELVARGIANILSKSDLRNGQTIGFA
jgi:hypothetical protein